MTSEYADRRQMTLAERLADERIVFLWGQIDGKSAGELIMRMLELASKSNTSPISLYINSPGGVVDDTMAIYDTMQYLKCDIQTICIGQACSGAAIILASGTKGKRMALPHSKIMMHQPYGGVTGQAADIQIQAREMKKIKATLNEIISIHSGKSVADIAPALERDHFLTPQEAIAFGIIDSIIPATKIPSTR